MTRRVERRQATPGEMLDGMRDVRWLSDLCGLPPLDIFPSVASALLDDAHHCAGALAYAGWWIRHPRPGSFFEAATRHLLELPDDALVATLRRMGYGGLLYRRDGKIVGHVFFQRHGAELCAFSCSVGEGHRGENLSATFLIDFVAFASQLTDVVRARVGAGNHVIAQRMVTVLTPHVRELGWRLRRDASVEFTAADADRPAAEPQAT